MNNSYGWLKNISIEAQLLLLLHKLAKMGLIRVNPESQAHLKFVRGLYAILQKYTDDFINAQDSMVKKTDMANQRMLIALILKDLQIYADKPTNNQQGATVN